MKKGELQIQETILVMFIFLIVLSMILVMVYRFTNASIENAREDLRDNEIFSLLMTLPNQLSYSYLGSDYNAVDTSRLFGLNLTYLGYKTIIIEQVYPQGSGAECSLINYPNCDQFILYEKNSNVLKNKIIKDVPISLYYPLEDQYRAGRLIIENYY